MFGSILSRAIKIATVPLDMAESVVDVAVGGDGTKASKRSSGVPLPSALRDAVAQAAEDLDDE